MAYCVGKNGNGGSLILLHYLKQESPAEAGLFCIDTDALYAFMGGGFGGEIGLDINLVCLSI